MQQQQHLMQMQPMMAAYYPNNVTTDHIQQYLDENKSLILKIVESQNSGKLSECAENQARLQRNLMYLAAIADSQPQPPTLHSQFPASGIMQPGAHYLQHQQAQQMSSQSLMAARSSLLYSQQQFSALQQQQALHSQLGMSSGGSGGLHMLQSEANSTGGTGALGAAGFPDFGRGITGQGLQTAGRGMAGGSKQDIGSAEGRGGSSGGHGGEGGETLYLKANEEAN
ncbi:GRF1-interacting factor 1-like isoform X1 [Diospyros lotus]|uniref:GRF1-interacting factor 1-like isoform X1 n=2 Tax=Diospyros lotus TaxID=55363 RepID=UPI00224D202E|nr:GRF1-interacting factor 1-like isoform X1 [Diospyros lotus]XP_052178348.1 GRF1-interacting factor 1-like isoform X1 [Diospyros lotus]